MEFVRLGSGSTIPGIGSADPYLHPNEADLKHCNFAWCRKLDVEILYCSPQGIFKYKYLDNYYSPTILPYSLLSPPFNGNTFKEN